MLLSDMTEEQLLQALKDAEAHAAHLREELMQRMCRKYGEKLVKGMATATADALNAPSMMTRSRIG